MASAGTTPERGDEGIRDEFIREAEESESGAVRNLFDLRMIIGGLFVVYGVYLTIRGLFDSAAAVSQAAGVRIKPVDRPVRAGHGPVLHRLGAAAAVAHGGARRGRRGRGRGRRGRQRARRRAATGPSSATLTHGDPRREVAMSAHAAQPGTRPDASMLIDVDALLAAYHDVAPDPADPAQRVLSAPRATAAPRARAPSISTTC